MFKQSLTTQKLNKTENYNPGMTMMIIVIYAESINLPSVTDGLNATDAYDYETETYSLYVSRLY
jgi:hypothetical protein